MLNANDNHNETGTARDVINNKAIAMHYSNDSHNTDVMSITLMTNLITIVHCKFENHIYPNGSTREKN